MHFLILLKDLVHYNLSILRRLIDALGAKFVVVFLHGIENISVCMSDLAPRRLKVISRRLTLTYLIRRLTHRASFIWLSSGGTRPTWARFRLLFSSIYFLSDQHIFILTSFLQKIVLSLLQDLLGALSDSTTAQVLHHALDLNAADQNQELRHRSHRLQSFPLHLLTF